MRILILNWRDIKNPKSGGAEVLTHEVAKRWVKMGHVVTQLSSGFPGTSKSEIIDRVRIVRLGKWWSVHILSFFYYTFYLRKKIDVIIDEVHWYPFFSGLYARKKTVLLVCEVADKLFYNFFPFPFSIFGRTLEKVYLYFYKNIPTIAISNSTKKDLVKDGFKDSKICVLPMGLNMPYRLKNHGKEKNPTIVYLGRLIKLKGIEDAISVCVFLKNDFSNIRLWVLGRGDHDYENKIKNKVRKENLDKNVLFWGYVSEGKKFELLQKAHVLITPSAKEGYGLTVAEAGIVGTPTVAYNVEGLRDIIKSGKNGLLVDCRPSEMANGVAKLFVNKELYKILRYESINSARKLSWDRTANRALDFIKANLKI